MLHFRIPERSVLLLSTVLQFLYMSFSVLLLLFLPLPSVSVQSGLLHRLKSPALFLQNHVHHLTLQKAIPRFLPEEYSRHHLLTVYLLLLLHPSFLLRLTVLLLQRHISLQLSRNGNHPPLQAEKNKSADLQLTGNSNHFHCLLWLYLLFSPYLFWYHCCSH